MSPNREMTKAQVWAFRLMGASPGVWFFGFFLFHFLILAPMTWPLQDVVKAEIGTLVPPTQAHLEEVGTSLKTDRASIYYRYATPLSHEQVFDYYETELHNRGWVFVSEHDITLKAVGRDYCKGKYSLSLDYYGIGYNWKYELWLTAGESSDCTRNGAGSLLSITEPLLLLGCSVSWGTYAVILFLATWRMPKQDFKQFMAQVAGTPTGIWRTRIGAAVILAICVSSMIVSVYLIGMFAFRR